MEDIAYPNQTELNDDFTTFASDNAALPVPRGMIHEIKVSMTNTKEEIFLELKVVLRENEELNRRVVTLEKAVSNYKEKLVIYESQKDYLSEVSRCKECFQRLQNSCQNEMSLTVKAQSFMDNANGENIFHRDSSVLDQSSGSNDSLGDGDEDIINDHDERNDDGKDIITYADQDNDEMSYAFNLDLDENEPRESISDIQTGPNMLAADEQLISDHDVKIEQSMSEVPEEAFTCKICDKIFNSLEYLFVHIHEHSSKLICPLCEKKYSETRYLDEHILAHCVPLPFRCEQCPKKYSTTSGLNYHKQRDHGIRELLEKCPICNKQVTKLQIHMRYHQTPEALALVCSYCQKQCATKRQLKKHLRSHTGEKLHWCAICEKSFQRPGVLKKHLAGAKHAAKAQRGTFAEMTVDVTGMQQSHDEVVSKIETKVPVTPPKAGRVCQCVKCSKVFKKMVHLKNHMRRNHRNLCNICRKVFSSAKHLKEHILEEHGLTKKKKVPTATLR